MYRFNRLISRDREKIEMISNFACLQHWKIRRNFIYKFISFSWELMLLFCKRSKIKKLTLFYLAFCFLQFYLHKNTVFVLFQIAQLHLYFKSTFVNALMSLSNGRKYFSSPRVCIVMYTWQNVNRKCSSDVIMWWVSMQYGQPETNQSTFIRIKSITFFRLN